MWFWISYVVWNFWYVLYMYLTSHPQFVYSTHDNNKTCLFALRNFFFFLFFFFFIIYMYLYVLQFIFISNRHYRSLVVLLFPHDRHIHHGYVLLLTAISFCFIIEIRIIYNSPRLLSVSRKFVMSYLAYSLSVWYNIGTT